MITHDRLHPTVRVIRYTAATLMLLAAALWLSFGIYGAVIDPLQGLWALVILAPVGLLVLPMALAWRREPLGGAVLVLGGIAGGVAYWLWAATQSPALPVAAMVETDLLLVGVPIVSGVLFLAATRLQRTGPSRWGHARI